MNFLEAHRIVQAFEGGPPLEFLLGMSGTPNALELFVRASAAKRGRSANVQLLPFNTLTQSLLGNQARTNEVLLLFPWDFVPEADWRSGVPAVSASEDDVRMRAQKIAAQISERKTSGIIYVPAPIPPLLADPAADARLTEWLQALSYGLGGRALEAATFSLGNYLTSGSPFATASLDCVAEAIVMAALGEMLESKKVLVTDLDNVLWAGVIGEDGVDGIACDAQGRGYRHFLYQTMLGKLKREGVLLAAVSRNDEELARAPFVAGRTSLFADDFVAIVASYMAKSAQIRQLAEQLNLGLNAFVFVDDNPIELTEVENALSGISVLRFPESIDALPAFLRKIAELFPRQAVTAEDAQRTDLYRRRLSSMVPNNSAGADITEFLRGLGMVLTITDRSSGDRTRAVQLINKTNQFNLNGRRFTDDEVGELLAHGGRLLTAELADRTGSHGEILAFLMDRDRLVRAFVMSCRVFQRHVEFAFLAWLAGTQDKPLAMDFVETARNEPIRQFLRDDAIGVDATGTATISLDGERFLRKRGADVSLFDIRLAGSAQSLASG